MKVLTDIAIPADSRIAAAVGAAMILAAAIRTGAVSTATDRPRAAAVAIKTALRDVAVAVAVAAECRRRSSALQPAK